MVGMIANNLPNVATNCDEPLLEPHYRWITLCGGGGNRTRVGALVLPGLQRPRSIRPRYVIGGREFFKNLVHPATLLSSTMPRAGHLRAAERPSRANLLVDEGASKSY